MYLVLKTFFHWKTRQKHRFVLQWASKRLRKGIVQSSRWPKHQHLYLSWETVRYEEMMPCEMKLLSWGITGPVNEMISEGLQEFTALAVRLTERWREKQACIAHQIHSWLDYARPLVVLHRSCLRYQIVTWCIREMSALTNAQVVWATNMRP